MISEKDKKAILNGAFGVTSDGNKCKYIGLSTDDESPFVFVKYNSSDRIIDVKNLGEDLVYYSGELHSIDVVGLWEDKPEPFDLERALAGEPVKLRNGKKAYMKYIMPPEYKGSYPIRGYIIDPSSANEIESNSWTLDGMGCVPTGVHSLDIISMWKDPEAVSNNVTVTLPRALKEPQDEMWFVDTEGYMKSGYGKCVSTEAFNRRVFFGSEEDAQAWFDAMQNSRK